MLPKEAGTRLLRPESSMLVFVDFPYRRYTFSLYFSHLAGLRGKDCLDRVAVIYWAVQQNRVKRRGHTSGPRERLERNTDIAYEGRATGRSNTSRET